MLLNEKVAVITGSSRGIGKGIALRFAAEGARVVVNGRNEESVQSTAKEIRDNGGQCIEVVGDVGLSNDRDDLFSRTMSEYGRVDTLVNNAVIHVGKGERGPFLRMSLDGWNEFLAANLSCLFHCSHMAAGIMADAKHNGNIINIGSVGSVRAHRYTIAYDALKGAIDSFTRAVAVDLGPWGIRVNVLRPGPIMTERRANFSTAPLEPNPHVPLGRMGRPSDVAWAAVFLASDDASFVTGQSFEIDGGLLAQARLPSDDEGKTIATPGNIDSL